MTASAMWLYLVVVVGAVSVYLALPKSGRNTRVAGAVLGTAALAAVVAWIAVGLGGNVYFLLFAGLSVVAAVAVIIQTKAVYSALYFIVVILAVAALLVLMEAEFLAAALVIIYAGAILVTYLFVIMLASQAGEALYDRRARAPLASCFAGFLLVATIGATLTRSAGGPAGTAEPAATVSGNTESLGALLMTRYVVVLEVAGVLLLLAMVGAIAIARKQFPDQHRPQDSQDQAPGERGKTVAPF